MILFGICNTRNFERWKIVFRTMTDHFCANVLNLQPFFFAALCQSAHVVLHVVLFLDVLNACSGCPLVRSLVGLFFFSEGNQNIHHQPVGLSSWSLSSLDKHCRCWMCTTILMGRFDRAAIHVGYQWRIRQTFCQILLVL